MPRAHPGQTSFNAGELSPLILGRPDLAKYANGCQKVENMLPTVQGPAKRRGGLRFVSETKAPGSKVWLSRFKFSPAQSYVLEFGPLYVRFYANRGQLVNGGAPVEVVTPYTAADLTNSDGAFALDVEQRGDVLYIASANHWPRTLTRVTATTWTLAEFVTRNGPLLDQNPDKALRLYASARTGTVTVTASANLFTAAHVGALIRLDLENITIPPWEPAKAIEADGLRRSDGKTYRATNGNGSIITGSRLPIHEEGEALDGSGVTTDDPPRTVGINWQYQDAGYGVGRITAVASPTEVTVAVQAETPFPAGVVGSGNASNAWQLGAWGAHAEYPAHVFFWKGRLGFAGKRAYWLSVPREYDNFTRDIVGQVRADAGISAEIESTQVIRWLAPSVVLLVGTDGPEFVVRKGTETEPLGPSNIDADEQANFGSRAVQPVRVATGLLFAQASGRRVLEARYNADSGGYESPDLTVLAEHITRSGIVDWAWQQEPDRVLWVVLANGSLVALTLEREQEVIGWHRHPTQGFVEAVQVIPSPDGLRDDVWFVVRRTVAGVVRRFVEYMDRGHDFGDAQSSAFFLDSGLTYSGPPATTISGLDHLQGMQVEILADGAAHPPRIVDATGSIQLTRQASVAHVGLGYTSKLVPMPIEAGAARGTAQGKTKRVDKLAIRFLESLGCKVGPSEDQLEAIAFRTPADPFGSPPALFTGIHEIDFDGDYVQDGTVVLVQDQPLPMTVAAIMPEVTTYERG